MPKCKIPRPYTKKLSAFSESTTFNAKFFSVSFINRSLKCLLVTNLPSLPKKGELLIEKSIFIVGSSTLITGSASGVSASAIVSPILKPSIPTTAHISPAITSVAFFLPKDSNMYSSFTLVFFMVPSACINTIG